jgi:CTP-dependent riboflavin kinase
MTVIQTIAKVEVLTTVKDMAKLAGLSEPTMRRELKTLEKEGMLRIRKVPNGIILTMTEPEGRRDLYNVYQNGQAVGMVAKNEPKKG